MKMHDDDRCEEIKRSIGIAVIKVEKRFGVSGALDGAQ